MKCGPVNSQFLDHGREPKERGPRELDAQMAQVHEGLLRIAIGDMQLVSAAPRLTSAMEVATWVVST